MRCQYCNKEIPEDAVFCPECGRQQELPTCPECGAPVEEDAMFCAECGAQLGGPVPEIEDEVPEEDPFPRFDEPAGQPVKLEKKERNMIVIVVLAAVVLIVLALAVRFLFMNKDKEGQNNETGVTTEAAVDEEDTDEVDVEKADYNLMDNDELMLEGLVKVAGDDVHVLQWEKELIFYGMNEKSEKILLENVTAATIDEEELPEGVFDSVSANTSVTIEGRLYLMDTVLYIEPYEIFANGTELIAEAKKQAETASEYVLPQSSTVLLTSADVEGLSLREINYAKNEVYARHGRRFKSAELQNYFDGKSWYNGTIAPEAFGENLLSDIEKKNVEFLSNIEFSMSPNGYQLDAN